MNFQRVFVPIAGAALVYFGFTAYGWAGVAVVTGGIVMWALLHVTRVMHTIKRAAARPIGFVDSAVMLNAHLRAGQTLLHVIVLTKSLGELLSVKDQQPEHYRWTDGSQSTVSCEFHNGKLVKWELVRPQADDVAVPATVTAATASPEPKITPSPDPPSKGI